MKVQPHVNSIYAYPFVGSWVFSMWVKKKKRIQRKCINHENGSDSINFGTISQDQSKGILTKVGSLTHLYEGKKDWENLIVQTQLFQNYQNLEYLCHHAFVHGTFEIVPMYFEKNQRQNIFVIHYRDALWVQMPTTKWPWPVALE